MKLRVLITYLFLSGLLFSAEPPHIGYIFPAGGKQGSIIDVVIGGKNIKDAVSASVTGNRVVAVIIEDPDRDLDLILAEDTSREVSVLLSNVFSCTYQIKPEELNFDKENTRKINTKTDRENRRKKRKNLKNDQFTDIVRVRVAIMDDAEQGDRELRLVTSAGLSNKLTFQVGRLPEYNEAEPNNRKELANELPVLPVLVNGQVMPGDEDLFKFKAKKGQNLVIKADTRTLMPFIADAVPGWFQASLALYDERGNELSHADNYRYNQEPVLFFDIPEDGAYYIRIRDAIYRGREDFVYRLAVGELPFITGISPIGARFDVPTVVSIYGKNLPADHLSVTGMDRDYPVKYVKLPNKEGVYSNGVPMGFSELPELTSTGENNRPEKSEKLVLPVIVNGALKTPGAKNYYSFEGKKGEEVVLEVTARRLGSPLDSFLIVYDKNGKKLAENDDDPVYKWEGLETHHADSALAIKLPADGNYIACIYDLTGKGGEEYLYRLRFSAPQPDFELHSNPPNINIPKGGTGWLRIHAVRKNGFNGPIMLSLKEGAKGLKLDNILLPEGKNDIKVTISSNSETVPGLRVLEISGMAVIKDKNVTHVVTAVEDYMQAFAWRHLVLMQEQLAMITAPLPFSVAFSYSENEIVNLYAGKEIKLNVISKRQPDFKENLQLALLDAPEGITLSNTFINGEKEKHALLLRVDNKVKAGNIENLVLTGTANIPIPDTENQDNKFKKEKVIAIAPALSVVLVKPNSEIKKQVDEKVNELKSERRKARKNSPENVTAAVEKKEVTIEIKK